MELNPIFLEMYFKVEHICRQYHYRSGGATGEIQRVSLTTKFTWRYYMLSASVTNNNNVLPILDYVAISLALVIVGG